MNEYLKAMEDVLTLQDDNKRMMDDVLDLYKKHPDICNMLMGELLQIKQSIEEIEEELNEIKNEIY